MARKKAQTKTKTLAEKLQPLLKKEQASYDKLGIVRTFVITFPNRHKAPLLGRLGVKLIGMVGGIIQIQYTESNQN
jgi:hypothetical protein